MSKKLENTISTLSFLWGQTHLLFASCIEVNFYRDKFKTHLANYDPSITLDKVVVSGLLNYFLIIICSFLDEWNNEFTPTKIPECADRILKIKAYTKPIFKRNNKWSGLKDFRNVVLAHNLGLKGGFNVFDNSSTLNYKVPNDPTETLLLNTLINLAMMHLLDEFKDINLHLETTVGSFVQSNTEPIEAESELAQIVKDVEALKNGG